MATEQLFESFGPFNPSGNETVPQKPAFDTERVLADLRCGFHISHENECRMSDHAFVVTSLGSDIFVVELKRVTFNPPRFPSSRIRWECSIRRKKLLSGDGSGTLERLLSSAKADLESVKGFHSEYQIRSNKGGLLGQATFWERYWASEVDPELTTKLFQVKQEEEMSKMNSGDTRISMGWIVNADMLDE